MKNLTLILLLTVLVACAGPSKTVQNIAVYDFGLPAQVGQPLVAKVAVDEVTAADAVNHQQIRYRLNYDNPSRVYSYTESRWAATPAELLTGRLASLIQQDAKLPACALKLKVEVFDHVFSSPAASTAVVQLSALLWDKKSRKVVATQAIAESEVAQTANARGGAKALAQASESATLKAVAWANAEVEKNSACQW
ncbi:MAG: ABC-type transport auxiliary lipoprotein family protein [Methylophilaceae bacterium]